LQIKTHFKCCYSRWSWSRSLPVSMPSRNIASANTSGLLDTSEWCAVLRRGTVDISVLLPNHHVGGTIVVDGGRTAETVPSRTVGSFPGRPVASSTCFQDSRSKTLVSSTLQEGNQTIDSHLLVVGLRVSVGITLFFFSTRTRVPRHSPLVQFPSTEFGIFHVEEGLLKNPTLSSRGIATPTTFLAGSGSFAAFCYGVVRVEDAVHSCTRIRWIVPDLLLLPWTDPLSPFTLLTVISSFSTQSFQRFSSFNLTILIN
jgi:hypothetical protein